MINIIAAVSENNVIGYKGKIPWNLAEDKKIFRQLTTSNVVIMGRKTFEEIGRALPDRINIVVSETLESDGTFLVAKNLESGIEIAKKQNAKEIFLCGGERIYREGMEFADMLFVTKVKGNFRGDAFFPEIDSNKFILESMKKVSSDFDFLIYKRK